MLVKNISGSTKYFSFGRRNKVRGFTLASNATRFVPDSSEAITYAAGYAAQGYIQLITGPDMPTELVSPATTPASIIVQLTYNSGLAAGVLTIDGVTFTFASGSGQTPASVGYGANAAAAAANLKAAINSVTSASFKVAAKDLYAVSGTVEALVLVDTVGGTAGNSTAHTLSTSGGVTTYVSLTNQFGVGSQTQMSGGLDSSTQKLFSTQLTVGTAANLYVVTGFAALTVAQVIVTRAGKNFVYDTGVTVSGGTIIVPYVSGDTNKMVTGDIVNVIAVGL